MSLAKAAKDYYLQKLGELSPREDYYLRGGTATGHWRGSGATEIGLEGSVSAEGLVRLFDGEHPATGERLGRQLRRDGVAAWDLTFSADKSVSLLWALGDPETRQQVLEAFDEATTEAFGYLESVASATRGASKAPVLDDNGNPVLNEDGSPRFRVQTWPIRTSGYVAASFTEFTSRADDPQLHTHVVVANKVKGTDGLWRTLDGRLLYRHQLAAGYLHEAVLRRELTERLGVRWQPVHNGMADIAGFTRTQIGAFSKRRNQLEGWREEQGLPETPAARQAAVLATRSPKQDHPLEVLEAEWQRRAAEVGLTRRVIGRMMHRSRQIRLPDPALLAQRLASREGLTEKQSTFGRAEVVKEIAASLPGGATRADIETLADMFLTSREIIPILEVAEPAPPTES
ncbi:MAG: MobF family relaxase, partial [Acidimicrobiia bacterium]